MILVKDLLLVFITTMHISLMASNPVGPRSCEEKLGLQAAANKEKFKSLLRSLKFAESVFVEHIFYNATSETKTKSLKPLDGITIPAGSTNVSSILNSMHEINACLTSYLPRVIGKLTTHKDVKDKVLNHTHSFVYGYKLLARDDGMKDCWEEGELKVCPTNLANNQTGYEMRQHALGVLHTAVQLTEGCIKLTSDQ